MRSPRARRYVIRVRPDGSVRVTIPRHGTKREALVFARDHADWIARQRQRTAEPSRARAPWLPGRPVWVDGRHLTLTITTEGDRAHAWLDGDAVPIEPAVTCLKAPVQRHLRARAARELPSRVLTLAAAHDLRVACVSVRDQRTRWGSCSTKGRISLNWRLVQMPPAVRDYIIVHELMHLRQPNHSRKFWSLVEAAHPSYRDDVAWLRRHGPELL